MGYPAGTKKEKERTLIMTLVFVIKMLSFLRANQNNLWLIYGLYMIHEQQPVEQEKNTKSQSNDRTDILGTVIITELYTRYFLKKHLTKVYFLKKSSKLS